MDISKTYIKMCEEAEEIQKLFGTPLPPGTFWVRKSEDGYSEGVTGYGYKRLPEWIILPCQDQLQEIVNDLPEYPRGIINKLYDFADFVHRNLYLPKSFGDIEMDEACHFFNSMEQLWLAFVMKEKYQKVWHSKNWIKEVTHG